MLYFAYGSNLNHNQMANRCKGSKYLKKFTLNGHKLCFSHKTNHTVYGHANIIKSSKSVVLGAVWEITKKDEEELDGYEGVDYDYYSKEYFYINKKKVLVYKQKIYYLKKPSFTYLQTIIQGYKDCGLNLNFLKKHISKYKIDYEINWK